MLLHQHDRAGNLAGGDLAIDEGLDRRKFFDGELAPGGGPNGADPANADASGANAIRRSGK